MHTIDHSTGFASHSDLLPNGSTTFVGSAARLTDGGAYEQGYLYARSPVYVGTFSTSFTFQLTAGSGFADGFAFSVADGSKSITMFFDTYQNVGDISANSLSLQTPSGTVGTVNLDGTGIDLHSRHVFKVDAVYNGTTLAVTLTDTATAATVRANFPVDIPAELEQQTGFPGFSGYCGGETSTQDIQTWTFDSRAPQLTVTGVSPGTIAQGSPDTTLTVSGTGFVGNSIVKWNGLAQQTSFVSYNKLTAVIPASLLKTVGTAQVTVTTPHVGTSNAKTVTIAVTTLGLTVGPVRRFPSGDLAVPILLTNTGYNSAPSLKLTTATLNNLGAKTTLPLSFGTVAAYYPTAALLTFPMTAGEAGNKVTLKVGGTFTGGTFSNSVTVTLP